MNFISNNCLDGWLYKSAYKEYRSPLVSFSIQTPYFLELIKNFDNINFNNIQIYREIFQFNENGKHKFPIIIIDNKIRLDGVHFDNLTDNEIIEKYQNRLAKFDYNDIYFIYCKTIRPGYDITTNQNVIDFDNINTSYKKYYVTNESDKINLHNTEIIKIPNNISVTTPSKYVNIALEQLH